MKNFKPILTAMSLCMALAAAAAPVRQHLHDDWQFRQARLNNWYPATVPGTVHTDLMANRIIEDPYFRLNERGVQWVDKEDWIYETHFEADAGLLARERIELVFEGLDTYADVYLNDEKVLAADNMFRRWRTEVKRLLRPGENTLKVYFHSPIKVDLPKYDSLPYRYEAVNDQSANGGLFDKRVSVFARKAGYHYGWDWGPRLVTSGIWRPVYLEGWSGARISDVFYRQQEVTARRARVEVEVEIASARDLAEAVVTVASPGEGIEASVTAPLRSGINKVTVPLDIASPKLWWTRELGEPHLYEFRASVAAGDASDSRTTRIGLRSLRLVRDKVADGTTFYFELNGEPLFAKGANYIPCDCFLPRVTRETYERTIRDAVDVNMNMLRVWGGGIYEDDFFYELCDREGILIWQDFMYACAVYPAEGALLENMRLEAVDNVKRLRNHACVVYWCGNNENQDSWLSGWKYDVDKVDPKYSDIIWKQYEEQYYRMLAQVVAEYAPDMGYQPTSPFSDYGAMSNDHEGDRHYWEVWHAKKPITEYNRQRSRFFSEYGFQSFPCFETVKRYAPLPGDQDITSEVMMSHQRGGEHANNLIKSYLLNEYHEPRDFESFLYASQILQGDAIKTAIEAHRRDKGYCWGSLYWQHNDCWPVASWSSRDWYGVWKAQHYFARYAFADILISPILDGGRLDIYAVSDLLTPEKGTLCVRAVRLTGGRTGEFEQQIDVPANASTKVAAIDTRTLLNGAAPEEVVIQATFTAAGKTYRNNYFLVQQKTMNYPKATLHCKVDRAGGEYDVTVRSDNFARGVYLSVEGETAHFSDNFFDLMPGETRTVRVASELNAKQLARRLKSMSLADTY